MKKIATAGCLTLFRDFKLARIIKTLDLLVVTKF